MKAVIEKLKKVDVSYKLTIIINNDKEFDELQTITHDLKEGVIVHPPLAEKIGSIIYEATINSFKTKVEVTTGYAYLSPEE